MFNCLSVLNKVLKKRREGRYVESEIEKEKGEKCQVHDTMVTGTCGRLSPGWTTQGGVCRGHRSAIGSRVMGVARAAPVAQGMQRRVVPVRATLARA